MTAVIAPAPCARCPFRKDVPIYLRRERRGEIALALANGQTFHCHSTVDYSNEDEWGDVEPDVSGSSMCAGAAKAMLLQGATTNVMRVAERLGLADLDRLAERGADVWDLNEWVRLAEGATVDSPEEADEIVTCSVVDPGCLAPAGFLGSGGAVVEGTEPADGECRECGEGLCTECGGEEMLCLSCRPWDEEED